MEVSFVNFALYLLFLEQNISEMGHPKWNSHKGRKVTELNFWRKMLSKMSKITQYWRFWGFDKTPILLCTFFMEYESTIGLIYSISISKWFKTVSLNELSYEVDFLIWWDIQRYIYLNLFVHKVVIRHTYSKLVPNHEGVVCQDWIDLWYLLILIFCLWIRHS